MSCQARILFHFSEFNIWIFIQSVYQALVTLSLWLIKNECVRREREEVRYFYVFTFVLGELNCGSRTSPISCSDSP